MKTKLACLDRGRTRAFRTFALSVSLCAWGTSAAAQAVPECSTLDLPNPIFGAGGSAITATLKKVAAKLAGADDPVTILYSDPSACTGYQQFVDGAVTSTFKYWDADGAEHTCNPPLEGQAVDFAHMGNAAELCGAALPAGIGDFPSPIQTLNLITDKDSSEDVISAEALYLIYGLGPSAAQADPWTNDAALFKRSNSAFVQLLLSTAINVPAASFKGTNPDPSTNGEVASRVAAAGESDPNSALGFVSGSAADAARSTVKTLAYQHYDQTCGYLPDSDPTSFDKANVRSGQYYLWERGHFFAPIDSNGDIENPVVRDVVGWFAGTSESPEDINVRKIVIEARDIPDCAMNVSRDSLLGPLSSYAPAEPCGCYFDFVATGDTACGSCEDDNDCGGTSKCRFGFCEAY
jgi:hypothetical protein